MKMASDDWPYPPRNVIEKVGRVVYHAVNTPITWFRETIVAPNRPKYYYYHRKFQPVPDIDECYEGDEACVFEANQQFKRNRKVEAEILKVLRHRREDCIYHERPDHLEKCEHINQLYDEAAVNWFIKYGDLGRRPHVVDAFMKQKHRLISERRRGSNDGNEKTI